MRKIEEKYLNAKAEKATFSVSMQHYTIAVNAFIDTVKEFELPEYQFSIRETQTSEVIATYIYKQGMENLQYSYSTAVGLFNAVINIVLLLIVNKIATLTTNPMS